MLALLPITPILQTLPALGPRPPGDLHKMILHAVTSHGLPVDPLGHLDGGHGGEPCGWVGNKQLQPQVLESGVKMVSAETVASPAVLQTLLSHQGQTLSEGIHGVDRPSVMVDTALVRPAVPVLSQPGQI